MKTRFVFRWIFGCAFALLVAANKQVTADVVTRFVNQTVTAIPDGPNQMYDLDVNLDGTTDLTFRSIIGLIDDPTFASFADIQPPFGTINGVVIDGFTGDGFPTVSRLSPGAVVSAASIFSGNNDLGNLSSQFFPDPATGNFQNQSGFVGFQFQSAGNTFYGFAQISVNDLLATNDPLAIFIGQVSYETTAGTAATVAVIPEPSLLFAMLFGAGGWGLLALRSRLFTKT